MNEPAPIKVTAIHYQVLAAVGLAMIAVAQRWQEVIDLPNIFLGAFGAWMILLPKPRVPMLFILLAAVVQMLAHYNLYQSFRWTPAFVPFEPTTLLLAGGLLIFLGSQYRLVAIKWHATPFDPRFTNPKPRDDAGRPIAPMSRPESVLTPDEIVRFVMLGAAWVLLGQWGWSWLNQRWQLADFSPRFVQVAFVIWIVVIGLFIGAGIVGYWRRAHSDPETARMYLQEIAWSEARREFGRIGRWIAWGKKKVMAKRNV